MMSLSASEGIRWEPRYLNLSYRPNAISTAHNLPKLR
jgi:hypothetical protein